MVVASRRPRWLLPWRWPVQRLHALLALALLAWATLACFGPVGGQGIAEATYDRMQQVRLWASSADERLLIVDIDERSLAEMAVEFGRWPWPRDTLATLLEHAEREGVVALVFDILFSDPDRLHPGGDRALAAAAEASRIALYPAARLPAALDARSELTADRLPGLARAPAGEAGPAPQVSMILPFMRAMVDSGRLATHTALPDTDGKIRHFAWHERLAGGWTLRSMPAAVAEQLGGVLAADGTARRIVWRARADAYPRVPFATAWACAEGRRRDDCPTLRGRILVLGASASSLHDVHATPLSSHHAGVDVLATLIDNALHQRAYHELGASWRFILAVATLAVAWALVKQGSAGATRRALVLLPPLLLAVGYASLHTERVYLDLMLPATLALGFLSGVSLLDALRCWWLGRAAQQATGPQALACGAPAEAAEWLERAVFDCAAREGLHVSGCRAVSGDAGGLQGLWVLWGLADEAVAVRVAGDLRQRVPRAWSVGFAPGPRPQQALFETLARRMPTQETPALENRSQERARHAM